MKIYKMFCILFVTTLLSSWDPQSLLAVDPDDPAAITGSKPPRVPKPWANKKSKNDRDGDGIANSLESSPYTIGNTSITLNPDRKDLIIVVFFYGSNSFLNRPTDAALQLVMNMFDKAPVKGKNNKPENRGIKVHIVTMDTSVFLPNKPGYQAVIGTIDANFNYDWAEFDQLKEMAKTALGLAGKPAIYHSCLGCYQFGNVGIFSSGISRNKDGTYSDFRSGGADFILSIQTIQSDPTFAMGTAGTIAHELGHNLGLTHGGFDHVNYKPNYLSIMNYLFQFDGVTKGGTASLDYSPIKTKKINENKISEKAGLGRAAKGYQTAAQFAPNIQLIYPEASSKVDWDGNGTLDKIKYTLNLNDNYDTAPTWLVAENNWKNVNFTGGGTISAATGDEISLGQEKLHHYASRYQNVPVSQLCPPFPTQETPLSKTIKTHRTQQLLQNAKPLVIRKENQFTIYSLE